MEPENPLGERPGKPEDEAKPESISGRAIVQCDGFRCLATRTRDGQWVNQQGKPLKVLAVVTLL